LLPFALHPGTSRYLFTFPVANSAPGPAAPRVTAAANLKKKKKKPKKKSLVLKGRGG
ncbi:MAG: hypothetical protein BJ554DRAFT_4621, partial [Olpidium bornovanus]